MEVKEIFAKINAHMVRGLMLHEQLANYFDFLQLRGYKRLHEYHYLAESVNLRLLNRYYINGKNKLIIDNDVESVSVIPDDWYRYERLEVSPSAKRQAVKTAFDKWLEWEQDTLKLYEGLYSELVGIEEVAIADFVNCLICDVAEEVKQCERTCIELKSVDYDLTYIYDWQERIHNHYKNKTADVTAPLC